MQINANGINIHYTLEGPPDAPVILFSHSLATDAGMWAAQASFAGDYRLLNYDTRGHGNSGAPGGDYSLQSLADDAAALLTALDIDRVHWVGISMGGMIGQAFALAYPRRLLSLSLCDTMSELPAGAAPAWEERIRTAVEQGMEALVAPTIERWFSPAFTASAHDQVDRIRAMIRATPVVGYLGCSRAIMALDLTERLSAITAATLIVVGEDDPSTPPAASELIHGRINGSQLQVVPGARHLCNIEKAGEFNAVLQTFLHAL